MIEVEAQRAARAHISLRASGVNFFASSMTWDVACCCVLAVSSIARAADIHLNERIRVLESAVRSLASSTAGGTGRPGVLH